MVTHENIDIKTLDIKYFCIRHINDIIEQVGNSEILSIKLNEPEGYVDGVINRDSFMAILRLYKKTIKIIGVKK